MSKLSKAVSFVTMTQIDESVLSPAVVRILNGYEAFTDTDNTTEERIYMGTVFSDILGEDDEKKKLNPKSGIKNKETLAELEELNHLVDTEYFQIIKP